MRRTLVCSILVLALCAAACSDGEDTAAYCTRYESARRTLGPIESHNFRAGLDEMHALSDAAPAEIAADAEVAVAAFEGLRPQADRLESGELTWNEFGEQYLAPMMADPEVAAANGRLEAFASDHCDTTG